MDGIAYLGLGKLWGSVVLDASQPIERPTKYKSEQSLHRFEYGRLSVNGVNVLFSLTQRRIPHGLSVSGWQHDDMSVILIDFTCMRNARLNRVTDCVKLLREREQFFFLELEIYKT